MALKILHPNQYATHSGAQKAAAQMNLVCEKAQAKAHPVWAVAIDVSKMFNMLSAEVSLEAARFMGLADENRRQIGDVLKGCRGIWRMPNNTASPPFIRSRGLPQGLATSVSLAEVSISIFLWRLHRLVDLESVAYVEDLNLIAKTREELERALVLGLQFIDDFHLVLSRQKTYLWGTNHAELLEVGRACNLEVSSVVATLGMEWSTVPSVLPSNKQETLRIQDAVERLRRLSHLPVPLLEKAWVVNIGCLSPIAYSPIPIVSKIYALRASVRKALGQFFGAQEILFEVVNRTSVDPLVHWILAAARLMHHWANSENATLGLVNLSRKNSRIAALCRVLKTLSWNCTLTAIKFHDGRVIRGLACIRLRYLIRILTRVTVRPGGHL